jgi:glycosyltransferase involved in cell wall biosynthesis
MSQTQVVLLRLYVAIIAIWPVRYLILRYVLSKSPFLTPGSPAGAWDDPPLVSAIIPARDEEAMIADCLGSVCRQVYPRLEILVIDDRSTDRTNEIAQGFAERDARVRVLSNDQLPPGWTGKTYVLHRAAFQARGQWLWFLDADTVHAPEFLSVMMQYARTQRAALVSLLPELRCETFWEQVVQPLGGIVLMQSFPLHKVNDDRSKLAFANGQSILVERSAYEAAGGHEAVRDRFVEDIGLAQKVKALGLPIRTTLVRGLVTCRMYASLGQLMRGWSRILYDALDRKHWRLLVRLLDPLVFCQAGQVAFLAAFIMLAAGFAGPFPIWLLGLSIVHHALMYPVFSLVYRTSVPDSKYVGWFPLGNLLIDTILVRSILMCLTGRVTWRGTSYGSATLSAHPEPETTELRESADTLS